MSNPCRPALPGANRPIATACLLAVALAVSLPATHSRATDYVWDGEFSSLWNHIFTTPGGTFQTNWSPDDTPALMIPGLGDRVFFQDTVANTTVDLNGDRTVDEVLFGGTAGYTLDNNTLTLADGLLTATGSATHTINSAVALGDTGAWSIGDTATVVVNGEISDPGNSFTLVKTGTGTLQLTENNSHAGTTVMGGVLLVDDGDQLGADMATLTLDGGELRAAGAFSGGAFRELAVGAGGGVFNTNGFDAGWDWIITGSGTLEKSGAGTLSLTTGSFSTHTGLIRVTGGVLELGGAGSSRTIGGDLTLDGGDAHVLSDSQFNTTSNVVVNNGTLDLGATDQWLDTLTVGTGGVVTMTDGEFRADGDVVIDGGQFLRSSFVISTGQDFRLASGHSLTVQNGGLFEWGGGHGALDLTVAGTSFLVTGPGSVFRQTDTSGSDHVLTISTQVPFAVEQGGELEAEYLLLTQGILTVDGAGSQLDVTHGGTPLIEHRIGNSRLTLSNGATGSFESTLPTALIVGNIFTVGQNATVEVFSGSSLTIQSLKMDTTGQADFFVRGAGSTVDQVGSSTSTIGRTTGHGQRLHLQDQGVFNTGTGLTTVNATGTINIESGATLNLNGSLEVNGGVVNISDAGSSLVQTGGGDITINGPGFAATHLNINNGGALTTGAGTTMVGPDAAVALAGGSITTQGVFQVNGGAVTVGANSSILFNDDVNINGGTFDVLDTGIIGFVFTPGKTLTVSNGAQFHYDGHHGFRNDTTYAFTSGADATFTGYFDVGVISSGTLLVDGPGTTVTTNTADTIESFWGLSNGSATVTISNDAVVTNNAVRLTIGNNASPSVHNSVQVLSGADFYVNDLFLRSQSGSTSSIVVDGGALLHMNGDARLTVSAAGSGTSSILLTDGGGLIVEEGSVSMGDAGSSIHIDGGRLWADTIDLTPDAVFTFTSGELRVGTFNGDLTNEGGTLYASHPTQFPYRTLTVNGDYTQEADATLWIGHFSDEEPGETHDSLVVNGHLSLAGTLRVRGRAFSILAAPGDEYDILDWDTLSGAFDAIVFDADFPWWGWNTQDLYTTGVIRYEHAGDLNSDGMVGAADLDLLLAHWGETSHPFDFSAGDASGDSVAGQADLDIILENWGAFTFVPPGDVPEPGSAVLLGLALLGAARRRRRV